MSSAVVGRGFLKHRAVRVAEGNFTPGLLVFTCLSVVLRRGVPMYSLQDGCEFPEAFFKLCLSTT